MRPLFFAVSLLASALPFRSLAQAEPIEQRFYGTWKLVSYIREETVGGAKSDVMGSHPTGYINYGRDGRVIVMIAGSGRKKPVGAVPNGSEAEALVRSMIAYAGTFVLDPKAHTVTHRVDVSWNELYTRTDQVRSYRFEGNRLNLATVPSPDPVTGTKTVRTLIWERVK